MTQQLPSCYNSKMRNQGHFKYYSDSINNQTCASVAICWWNFASQCLVHLIADERCYRICEDNLCHTEYAQFNGSKNVIKAFPLH